MSFSIKALRATITLRNGTFPNTNSNTIIIENHRIKATISKPGGEDKNTLTASIYGLPLSVMETASTLAFYPQQSEKNFIRLEAGDDTGIVGTVFEGEFTLAPPTLAVRRRYLLISKQRRVFILRYWAPPANRMYKALPTPRNCSSNSRQKRDILLSMRAFRQALETQPLRAVQSKKCTS